jgi:hypothetical protein
MAIFFNAYLSFSQVSASFIIKECIKRIDKNNQLNNISSLIEKGLSFNSVIMPNHQNPRKSFINYRKISGQRKSEIESGNVKTVVCFDGKSEVIFHDGKIITLPYLEVRNENYDTILSYNPNHPPKEPFFNDLVDAYYKGEIDKFEFIGEEVIGENLQCFVIKSNLYRENKTLLYYIDNKDYLIRLEKKIDNITKMIIETYFYNYRICQDFLLPFELKIYTYGLNHESYRPILLVKYNSIILNPKIDDSIFDCSKLTKPVIKE